MQQLVTVFICSTFSDLSREREAVMDAVRRLQMRHDSMEFFGARPNQPLETCLAEVRRSDIIVVIVGHRYGSVAPGLGISSSEAEYEEGRRLRKPCLVYIRDENVPILPRMMGSDPENMRRLNRWKESLRNHHTVATFAQGEDLAVQVAADLSRAVSDLAEAKADRTSQPKAERSLVLAEIGDLVDNALERGLKERDVLSIVRRGLAGAMAVEGQKEPTVFLSYSRGDRATVRKFADELENWGISVWFDEMRLQPGDNWAHQIERALDSSDYVAFFVSKNSMKRGYVQKELKLAFERSRMLPVDRALLLPVLLD